MKSPILPAIALSIILLSACLFYVAVLPSDRFGFFHDDGIYVTTAKALATGQGYRIISLPYEPAQTKYPPLYPFLLSLIWRAYPEFPENLLPMMMLSVVATICFLGLCWRYLVRQSYADRWTALIVVALASVNAYTVVFAVSVLSEMLFATLSILALHLAEEYEKKGKDWILGLGSGLVIGLAFLTRSSAVALLIAIALYFLFRRRWRIAILPVAVAAAFVVGWQYWCYLNLTPVKGVNVSFYTNYSEVFNEIIRDIAAQNNISTLLATLAVVANNALMFVLVSPVVVCLGIEYAWIRYFGFAALFVTGGFIRHRSDGIRLMHFYVICYVVLHLFVPFATYARYIFPLLPFLLLFAIVEIKHLIVWVRRELTLSGPIVRKISAGFIGMALLIAVCVAMYNYSSNIHGHLTSISIEKSPKPLPGHAQAIEWVRENTQPSDVLICSNDPIYYLYNGRKAVTSIPVVMTAVVPFESYNRSTTEDTGQILRMMSENNIRYLILTPVDFESEGQPDAMKEVINTIIDREPDRFSKVFEFANGQGAIYRIENTEN